MQRTNLVLKQLNVNPQKIVFEDFNLTDDKQYVVSKIWYQENESSQPHTLFIQPTNLKVYEMTKNNDIILELSDKDHSLFEALDKLSINVAKTSGVIRKYSMKDVKYKTIINEVDFDTPKKQINALRLKIINGDNHTKFFLNDRVPKSIDDVKKLLTRGTEIKVIIELDELIVDLKNNVIFTNVILKQALVKKMRPLKTELCEYSFVESDCEQQSEQVKVSPPNKDTMLNTQTEYLDQNTAMSEKSKSTKEKPQVKQPVSKPVTKQTKNQVKASSKSDESEQSSEDENYSSDSDEGSIDVENFMMAMKNHKRK